MDITFPPLEVLTKELKDCLVTPFILLLDAVVTEIGTSGHPAVDLILEGLYVLGHFEGVLKLLDLLIGLLLGSQKHGRDRKALGIRSIYHGGVDLGGNGEGVRVCLDAESNDLATPAILFRLVSTETQLQPDGTHSDDSELLDGRVLILDSLYIVRNLAGNLGGRICAEEVSKLLLLVVVIGRVADIELAVSEALRADDDVSSYISMGQGLPLNQSGIKTLYFW